MKSKWLGKVIGHMPNRTEMEDYAWELYNLALHSPEMIMELCTEGDYDGFDWMMPFNKQQLKKGILKNHWFVSFCREKETDFYIYLQQMKQ